MNWHAVIGCMLCQGMAEDDEEPPELVAIKEDVEKQLGGSKAEAAAEAGPSKEEEKEGKAADGHKHKYKHTHTGDSCNGGWWLSSEHSTAMQRMQLCCRTVAHAGL